MKRLAILGASGHGKVIADCAEVCGWETVIFFDDAWPAKRSISRWSVEGDMAALLKRLSDFDGVLVAIGNNAVRQSKLTALAQHGAKLTTLVHPSALVSRSARVGVGSVVLGGVVINVDASIGMGAIINTGATVDHDCVLGIAVHISPGAHLAGGVVIGDQSWLGIGSCVRQLVRIGSGVTVGAGAAVVSDVADACTVVGVPARVL
ncbi:acetyltransferase [Halopseudomonas nanhaiensis]|uniref:acetyltransferase n=1 Tax=Halopseudomonas nanhaiensis TaxID=2830842 RepID=UPI001CBEFC74|nr:acetyltransferase [Halopseudomonas nanhaiensis]UAW99472.1 acetyltransferase [Halopseudomonas nanhaiensis]